MRLLLVEDDTLLGRGLRAGLVQGGFAVDWVETGEDAEAALATTTYDGVVLDLGLPTLDGLTLLRRRRAAADRTPVLVLTARDTIDDRVTGLDAGGDDYMVKPFSLAELQARLRALLRRHCGEPAPTLRSGRIELDPAARSVRMDGVAVAVSGREYAVLNALMRNAGRIVSRRQLEDKVYSWDDEVGSNAIEVHIHNLRRKLGHEAVQTVRGLGFQRAFRPRKRGRQWSIRAGSGRSLGDVPTSVLRTKWTRQIGRKERRRFAPGRVWQ